MKIAVLGAGTLGSAVGRRCLRHGHEVVFASRSPNRLAAIEDGAAVEKTDSYRDAVERSEVAFLAATWEHAPAVVAALREVRGRILVDCSNPESADGRSLALGTTTSGAEEIARQLPGLRLVKALNHVYAELLLAASPPAPTPTALLCGDDAGAKEVVGGLLRDCGLDPLDCGPLASARWLEPVAMLMVELVRGRGWGPADIALAMPRRPGAAAPAGP